MAACTACRAPIRWLKTPNGRSMPLDLRPDPEGNVIIENGLAVLSPARAMALSPEERFLPHWATCPEAASFRKVKKP